jgi:hypothetical protein
VTTWLDESIDPSSPPFQKLASLNENSTPEDLGDDYRLRLPVTKIAENPYRTRVWIKQETAFAKDLIIHCKDNPMSRISLLHYKRVAGKKVYRDGWSAMFDGDSILEQRHPTRTMTSTAFFSLGLSYRRLS